MKPLILLLVTAAAPPAAAQQMLYASTCGGDLVEILDYATAPTLRMIPRNSQHNGAQDIAVRPGTGLICVLDQVSSLPNLYEIDPLTGNAVNGASCFSWLSFSMSLEARYDNSLVGEEWMGAGRLMYTDTSLECFSSWGPATGGVNDGDIAQRNDGSFLASRAGSSALFFIHPSTGNATLAADFGISFSGLEIDTDGSIYGLTRDGLLYRVELTPPSVILLAVLPPATAGACFSNGWSGLAFSLPAYPIEFETVCTADPNSTGNAAGLSVDFNPAQPPATGAGVLGFRVADMPPDHAAILLTAPSSGSSTVGVGTLCLGSGTTRVFPARRADANGVARFRVNLDSVPGHGAAMAGDTLYFQVIFRDHHPGPTVDVSSTLRVMIH